MPSRGREGPCMFLRKWISWVLLVRERWFWRRERDGFVGFEREEEREERFGGGGGHGRWWKEEIEKT